MDDMPTLPGDYKYTLEEESEIARGTTGSGPSDMPERHSEPPLEAPTAAQPQEKPANTPFDAMEDAENGEDIFYDVHWDLDQDCPECAQSPAELAEDLPDLHVDVDCVREEARTPRRISKDGTPDIATHSVITPHSSKTRALEGATGMMRLWRMGVEDRPEGESPVQSPDRDWPLCGPSGSRSAPT
ncbi:hypothetical protein B0H16DRAFT_1716438 [Mycena metata]|uniref:Uncharacterized protein n=1 Tax=Mycena metata TaxID=1033252 RepID=A0AAD7JQS0_9AGAR|nr:hypothetical protein B0H16DRAFT_1716438 [Mycena metata]